MTLALVFAGTAVLYFILDRSAWALQSFRGEWGLVVGAVTVVAVLAVEWTISRRRPREAARWLGLGPSRAGAMGFAVICGVALITVLPVACAILGLPLGLGEGWWWLAIGIFVQAGIAEETVFRGFLFRHVREGRSFWRAAAIAAVPFVVVHLATFWTMEPVLAAVSLGLALSLTFPFAALYERAGNAIWPSAILHAVIQGAIKLVEVPDAGFMALALIWMGITALVPWLVFLLPVRRLASGAASA